jgi:hypothetical protein
MLLVELRLGLCPGLGLILLVELRLGLCPGLGLSLRLELRLEPFLFDASRNRSFIHRFQH